MARNAGNPHSFGAADKVRDFSEAAECEMPGRNAGGF